MYFDTPPRRGGVISLKGRKGRDAQAYHRSRGRSRDWRDDLSCPVQDHACYNHNPTEMKKSAAGHILIYRNSQKINGDSTPEYRGDLLLDGKTYDIGLWVYQSKSGMKYMSGSVIEVPGVLEHAKPNANDVSLSDF